MIGGIVRFASSDDGEGEVGRGEDDDPGGRHVREEDCDAGVDWEGLVGASLDEEGGEDGKEQHEGDRVLREERAAVVLVELLHYKRTLRV